MRIQRTNDCPFVIRRKTRRFDGVFSVKISEFFDWGNSNQNLCENSHRAPGRCPPGKGVEICTPLGAVDRICQGIKIAPTISVDASVIVILSTPHEFPVLLRCGVTLLSSKRKGGRLSPSYFGSVIVAFPSFSSSTPIYTSVEEEKLAGIEFCFISAWPLSLFFLNIRKTASSKQWGYIVLLRRGRAGV